MRHSRSRKVDPRRAAYLGLVSQIGSQLRDAYAKRNEAGEETQATLGRKIGVGRSTINKRLTGRTNLTEKTIADLVWALGHVITVKIYDAKEVTENHREEVGQSLIWNATVRNGAGSDVMLIGETAASASSTDLAKAEMAVLEPAQ